jgi:hypothetical protein
MFKEQAGMTINWKHKTGVLALSVAMLSVSAGAQVAPAGKPVKAPVEEVVQPAPSVDVETGQLLDKGPRRPPSVERGIKDPGVKSCGSCGMTGKEAAPPPVDDAAAPPSAEWEDPNGGQHFYKGCKWPRKCNKATERRAHDGPGGTPPSTTKKGRPKERDDSPHNRSSLLPVLGAVAALAALAAAVGSGGNDNPVSP